MERMSVYGLCRIVYELSLGLTNHDRVCVPRPGSLVPNPQTAPTRPLSRMYLNHAFG